MRRSALVACLLVVAACTGETGPVTLVTLPPTTTTSPAMVEELPGQLVTIDGGGNVVVLGPDGSNPVAITDDAGEQARYTQPFWSPQSDRLAWSEFSTSGMGVALSGAEGSNRTLVPMSAPPFYMYWSPDGEAIGVLHNGPQSIDFEFVDVEAATGGVVANGSPFYFSWSPDSERIVVHIQGEIFATLDRDHRPEDLGATGQGYQSPHWTPSGIFSLGAGGLEVRLPSGGPRVLATTSGPVAMVANDDGTKLAVQSFVPEDEQGISAALSETPALPTNRVVVVDVESGELEPVTERLSIGFFWSPDGQSLLILEPREEGETVDVRVWKDGETTTLTGLVPHPTFARDVLPFFDQYAQSLRLWSPDSAAVVLPGAVDQEIGLWILGVAGGEPIKVSEGSWAAWSG
jgi:TolB protein